jgi:transposase
MQHSAHYAGARQFCAIRSHLSTTVKHGMHFLDALVMLTDGRPWMPTAAKSTHQPTTGT